MTITLYWKYLKYEIDYETWKAAKIRITDNPEILNEAQAGLDDEDVNFCQVKLKEAIAHLNDMLYRFLSFSGTSGTDVVTTDNKSWQFVLNFHGRRSINADSLASEMHHYAAYYVLREWAKLALTDMHQAYNDRCEEEKNRIINLVYRKDTPLLSDLDPEPEIAHITMYNSAVKLYENDDTYYVSELVVPVGSNISCKPVAPEVEEGKVAAFVKWEDNSTDNPRVLTVDTSGKIAYTAIFTVVPVNTDSE